MQDVREAMLQDMAMRNLSQSTVDAYTRAVDGLLAFTEKSPEVITHDEVRQYLEHLRRQGRAPATRGVRRAGIRFFFLVTVRRPEVVRGLPWPKVPRREVRVLSGTEVQRLRDAMPSIKHRAVFATTYSCGLRISETCKLRVEDIDSKRMRILIRQAKGQKDRYVPLSPGLLAELRAYYRAERPRAPYLFPGQRPPSPMTTKCFYNVITTTSAMLGFDPVITPHTLRHSYATHQLELGLDLQVLQMILGHARATSTMRYLTVTDRLLAQLPSPYDVLGTERARRLG